MSPFRNGDIAGDVEMDAPGDITLAQARLWEISPCTGDSKRYCPLQTVHSFILYQIRIFLINRSSANIPRSPTLTIIWTATHVKARSPIARFSNFFTPIFPWFLRSNSSMFRLFQIVSRHFCSLSASNPRGFTVPVDCAIHLNNDCSHGLLNLKTKITSWVELTRSHQRGIVKTAFPQNFQNIIQGWVFKFQGYFQQ